MDCGYAAGRARRTLVAPNDQPWTQPCRFWLDEARTQPLNLSGSGGWLQWPGGSSKVTLEATTSGNVATVGLAQADLSALRLGTWWGELQFEIGGDTVGSLRFDLMISAGLGTGLGATKSTSPAQDVIVCATAPLDVVMLAIGVGGASQTFVTAPVQQLLGVTNVDDALALLAKPLSPADAQEISALLGGAPATLQNLLALALRRTGALSPGGGDWNPNL